MEAIIDSIRKERISEKGLIHIVRVVFFATTLTFLWRHAGASTGIPALTEPIRNEVDIIAEKDLYIENERKNQATVQENVPMEDVPDVPSAFLRSEAPEEQELVLQASGGKATLDGASAQKEVRNQQSLMSAPVKEMEKPVILPASIKEMKEPVILPESKDMGKERAEGRTTGTDKVINEIPGNEMADAPVDSLGNETAGNPVEQRTVSVQKANGGVRENEDAEEERRAVAGFYLNSEGYVVGYTKASAVLRGGLLVLPTQKMCTGVKKDAFAGLEHRVEEIYIPPNIRDVDVAMFDSFDHLLYIEVSSEHEVYASKDGILCKRNGAPVAVPRLLRQ